MRSFCTLDLRFWLAENEVAASRITKLVIYPSCKYKNVSISRISNHQKIFFFMGGPYWTCYPYWTWRNSLLKQSFFLEFSQGFDIYQFAAKLNMFSDPSLPLLYYCYFYYSSGRPRGHAPPPSPDQQPKIVLKMTILNIKIMSIWKLISLTSLSMNF